MRKIIIKAKSSDKAALIRKYETRDISEDPIESFEVVVHDDSETLKKLCNDPKIIDWSDKDKPNDFVPEVIVVPRTEVPTVKEVMSIDLVKEGLRKTISSINTRDMKTLLSRLMCLRNAIEFRAGSGMAPVTVVAESFGMPADTNEPVLSEGTVKLMLRRMADSSKADFDKKLLESMIETTSEYLDCPEYYSEFTPDFFVKKIFEYKWKEVN